MSQTRRPDLLTRVTDGEALILDRAAGKIHRLNTTASYIWNECDGRSAAEIAVRMLAHFDTTADLVLSDVEATLADFRCLGLVHDAGDAALQKTNGGPNE
jgi:Coenzyme PQQ synthesis protein D (PqqD)